MISSTRRLMLEHPIAGIFIACTPLTLLGVVFGIREGRIVDGIIGGLVYHLLTAGLAIALYSRRDRQLRLKPRWLQISLAEAVVIFAASWIATVLWGMSGTRPLDGLVAHGALMLLLMVSISAWRATRSASV